MNGLTHFLTGVLIQVAVFSVIFDVVGRCKPRDSEHSLVESHGPVLLACAFVATGILAFFSHGFLDSISRYTYHDGSPDKWETPFYGPWTYGMLAAAGIFAFWMIWRDTRFVFGMAFGLFYDLLDHNTFRVIEHVILQNLVDAGTISLGNTDVIPFSFHSIARWDGVLDAIDNAIVGHPVNHNENPLASIVEIILLVGMFAGLFLLNRTRVMPPSRHEQTKISKILVFLIFALWISDDVWLGLLGNVPGGFGPIILIGATFGTIGILLVVLLHLQRKKPSSRLPVHSTSSA
ncbi:hypothetical protein GF325_08635 [Candidatus Bathyarchaeota archaeon]|nr:hypothetical protein [Candidatus Bathyarchaeota archaeon]